MTEHKKDTGVWEKTAKNGKKYYGGKFNEAIPAGAFFSMFLNEYKKEGDNQPTFNILINEAKVQNVSFTPTAQPQDDEIPF